MSLIGCMVTTAFVEVARMLDRPGCVCVRFNYLCGRLVTVAVMVLPPELDIIIMVSNKGPKILDLCAPERSVIIVHAESAVLHRIYSSRIIDIKFSGLYGGDKVSDTRWMPERPVCRPKIQFSLTF